MGSSSVIRWMAFHMMTHAPLTWACEINCHFNGQVIGSRRRISLARNVEKRHRFWGARAFGSWQSIQIARRLQESVQEDPGRRVLHVVRIELAPSRWRRPFNGFWKSHRVSTILTKFFNRHLAGTWSVSRSQRCVVSDFLCFYVVQ